MSVTEREMNGKVLLCELEGEEMSLRVWYDKRGGHEWEGEEMGVRTEVWGARI